MIPTLIFILAVIVGYVARQSRHNKHKIRNLMAAVDNLKAAVILANTKLETLQRAVDKIVAAIDPAVAQDTQKAADDVNALGNALADLVTRIDQATNV